MSATGYTKGLLLFVLLFAAEAFPITYTWDTIAAVHSNRCIDVPGSSKNNGMQLQQWDCHGAGNQRFLPVKKGEDNQSVTYALVNLTSNKCLDVYEWKHHNGALIVQWDCHWGNNQLWRMVPNGTGGMLMKSVHTGKCIDVAGVATGNGAKLVQWDCWNGNNQTFKFTRTLK